MRSKKSDITTYSLQLAQSLLHYGWSSLQCYMSERWQEERELPEELFHYCELSTAAAIVKNDDVFLFDSRHCNDTAEHEHGEDFLRENGLGPSNDPPLFIPRDFDKCEDAEWCRYRRRKVLAVTYQALKEEYFRLARSWPCYVFCMSGPRHPYDHEDAEALLPEDNLSMWRGYARDASGACITFRRDRLDAMLTKTPGTYICPVYYTNGDKLYLMRFLFRVLYDIAGGLNGLEDHRRELHHVGLTRFPDLDQAIRGVALA